MKATCSNGHDFEYDEADIKSHFVMCGDSTDFGQVSDLINGAEIDLVYTDPPYGINEKGDRSNRGGLGKGGLAKAKKYDDFVDDTIDYAVKAFETVIS